MVATRCMTYNQAPYIKDALHGFIIQEISFPSVFIIVDDASTDTEPDILRQWVIDNLQVNDNSNIWKEMPYGQLAVAPLRNNNQSLFVILLLSENHFQRNKMKLRYLTEWISHSKYHAICEGDDFWLDPQKLMKQVQYLETHSKCYYLFTDRYIKNEIKSTCYIQRYSKQRYDTHDILSGLIPGLQTVMFPMSLTGEVQEAMNTIKFVNGDRLYPYIASKHGEIHCLSIISSAYRITGKGMSTSVLEKDWFFHASKDFYLFHQETGFNDNWAYRKGMSNYIGSFFKQNLFRCLFFPISKLYHELKKINPLITRWDCMMMIFFFLKRKATTITHMIIHGNNSISFSVNTTDSQ